MVEKGGTGGAEKAMAAAADAPAATAAASSSSSSSSPAGSPCAACKFLRRKCIPDCVFAPYFPAHQPQKFANVHRVFGASNVSKLLGHLPPCHRQDAADSLAFEADARVRDPVYGCVASLAFLQRQVHQLQAELADARSHFSHRLAGAPAAAAAVQPLQGLLPTPANQFAELHTPDLPSLTSDHLLEYSRLVAGGGSSYDASAALAVLGLTPLPASHGMYPPGTSPDDMEQNASPNHQL